MKSILLIPLIIIVVFGCSRPGEKAEVSGSGEAADFVEIPNSQLPVVYFEVVVKSGSADDPAGKEGLAWFTANYLQRGSKNYSREQIENELEKIGGRLNVRVDREVIVITGKTLLENLDRYYDLFSDILLNPAFPEEEAGKLRIDQDQALKDVVRDDVRLAEEVLIYGLYHGHQYSHPVEGLFSTMNSLKHDDARGFYNTNFVKGNIIVGISGNYPHEFAEKFKNDMNSFKAGEVNKNREMPQQSVNMKVILVQKDGKEQSQIRMGELVNYDRRDPGWFDFLIANTYLGQHRESFGRLFKTLRIERGMSYGVYSYQEHFRQEGWSKNPMPLIPFYPQYFSIWTYPKWGNTEFAVKLAIYEMNKLLSGGIDSAELKRCMDFQANSFPFLVETAEQKLARTVEDIYYDQPGFIDDFSESVYKAEAAGLTSVLNDAWSGRRLLIVIVADKTEELKAELLTKQAVLELPRGATSEGLDAVNDAAEAIDLGLKPEDITIIGAEELFH